MTAREHDELQAEKNLEAANTALEKAENTYTWPELEAMQAAVDAARAQVDYALTGVKQAGTATQANWEGLYARAMADVAAAQKKLDAMLSNADTQEVIDKKWQVELAQWKLDDANTAIDDAKIAADDAKKALEDAQKALADAKDTSPEIKASFAGLITNVNVSGGEEVKKGTVAVTLADPNKFEAEIMVSEMNILKVKLGENATAQLDAVQGMVFPAKVTDITPTATIQSGVVNYKVKVELQPLQARGNLFSANISQQQAQAGQQARGNLFSANISSGGQQRQMPTMTSQDSQPREGLTATISIVLQERSSVLLVPNAAITSRGGQAYVQVLKESVTEERLIQTGISNGQYTEVTSGLSEGEQVVVPQGTTTTTTSQQRQQQLFIPGLGR